MSIEIDDERLAHGQEKARRLAALLDAYRQAPDRPTTEQWQAITHDIDEQRQALGMRTLFHDARGA